MKLTYDQKLNVAYIHFREKTEEVTTLQLSDDVNIDLAPDGGIYGIELLNANEQLELAGGGTFIFENTSLGKHSELQLA